MRRTGILRLAISIAVGGLVTASSFDANAISKYNSQSLSCGTIKSRISSQGAVLLQWQSRSGNPNYNRFVKNANYCNVGQTTALKSVPASNGRCSVRYCVSRRSYDSFD